MGIRAATCACLLIGVSLATTSQAQGTAKQDKPAKADSGAVKKDPDGLKGISPFWEAVNRGNSAYIARDYDKAITEFREAITKEPQNALGHYRMAEAQRAKGDLPAAEASLTDALRYAGNNPPLRAKIQFLMADLKEREKAYDDAIAKWTDYEGAAAKPESKAYAETAPERKKRIETWKQLVKDYGAVKARIAKRLAEDDKK
ncbi:MAG: tetratricopeptide repeat protein [Myxococcales bacterium]|nr:tetratricopeptide repeat protein [Myxococcales bacterium]